METRNCKRCGKEFAPKMAKQIFCCMECKNKFYYEEQRTIITRRCATCGETFYPQRGQNAAKYCPKCAEAEGIKRKRFCPICGTLILSSYARYCCDECKKEARRRADRAQREQLAQEKKSFEHGLSTENKPLEHRKKLLSTGKDLATMVREALEHGMTYGKYVEMLEKGLEHGA